MKERKKIEVIKTFEVTLVVARRHEFLKQILYFVVFSHAIMIYLCNKFPNIPDYWYPNDARKRAEVNQFIDWYPDLRKEGSNAFLEKVNITDCKTWQNHNNFA